MGGCMIKKVAVLDGRVEHIYHDENDTTIIDGASFESRDYEYSEELGWYEVGYVKEPSELESLSNYVLEVDMRLIMVELGM